jgi:arsenate reductase
MSKVRVLFVCIHNSARSQMAEGLLRHLAGDRFEASSAGLEPGKLNPFAVKAMALRGIDISKHSPKGVADVAASGASYDYVIAVCDKEAADKCPVFAGEGKRLHWAFPDPSAAQGSDDQKLAFACQVRDLIERQIAEWIGG